jgi:DNA-binding NarL/FixJ family response regulator
VVTAGPWRTRHHYIDVMRALCVARHPILSEHLTRFFERFDVAAAPVVGMKQARMAVSSYDPDLALCDYDLLTPVQLESWRGDAASNEVPIIAVSMTKRPDEVTTLQMQGVFGFLYLPTLDPDAARALLARHRRRREGVATPKRLSWPGTTPVTRHR